MARSVLVCSVLFLVAACSSSGSTGGRPCVDDSVCESGQICGQDGTCASVQCTQRRDCPGSSTCLPSGSCGPIQCSSNAECNDGGNDKICRDGVCVSSSSLPSCADGGTCANGKVCSSTSHRCEDCNTTTNRCPVGQTCRSGSCEQTTTSCTMDSQCLTSGRVCDTGSSTCVSCSAARPCPSTHYCDNAQCVARPRCQNGQCTAPLTCDTSSNYCINSGGVSLCGRCTADAECQGAGSKCLALGGASYCGKACSTSSPCPSGFVCDPNFHQCIPSAARCENNCQVPGAAACTGGRSCDNTTGLCLASKRLCDTCSADNECGADGDKCLAGADGGPKVCAQNCDTTSASGRNCPSGFTCTQVAAGVRQCVSNSGQCVTDPCANVTCDRGSMTPYCDPNTRACVECRTSNDCPASDQICTNDKRCLVPGQCTGDQSCTSDPAGSHCCTTNLGQTCAQCCTNAHCPQATPYCVANHCSATQDPCAGVTCTGGQTCNPANGNCEGGGGTTCQTDVDCPPSALGSPQSCDQTSHTCYDPTGICATAADCAMGQQCLILGCTCASDADCRGALRCNQIFPGFGMCGA